MINIPTGSVSGSPAAGSVSTPALPASVWRLREGDTGGIADLASSDAVRGVVSHPALAARLLWSRGVRDVESAHHFLTPSLAGLQPPESLPDVDRGVELVRRAITDGKPIWIYGDYDVDGVTSTALLLELFRFLRVEARAYIPDRLREGYGLNTEAIRTIAAESSGIGEDRNGVPSAAASGGGLIITVDGGSNDLEELRLARELGFDVIVTDHHIIQDGVLDDPVIRDIPLIHPGRRDRPSPFPELCGVGVAYKFVWALGKSLAGSERVSDEYREFMLSALAFVALGTIADVVPLRGENRILAAYGLRTLGHGAGSVASGTVASGLGASRPGLRALMAECRLRGTVTAEDVAFRLAPHLNAAGRLGCAGDALDLLLTRDAAEGTRLARQLAGANRRRKEIERRMLEECEEEISAVGGDRRALVLAREGWHPGVAGIVAARLVDRYRRPTFVIAVDGELARGSARSVDSLPLMPLYAAGRAEVRSIGGHACAGGLTIDPTRLDAFRVAVEGAASSIPCEKPHLDIDAVLPLSAVDLRLLSTLERLAPFGAGNPTPIFRIDDVEVSGRPRLVGQREEHLTFSVRGGGRVLRAIAFGARSWAHTVATSRRLSLVCEIIRNEYRQQTSVELRVLDVAPGGAG